MGAAALPQIGKFAGGLYNDVSGISGQAEAAQNAAMAQQAAAGQQSAMIRQAGMDYQNKAADLAKATPQELMYQEKALQAGQQQLESQQKLLSAIDPALMEASKQALGILRGEKAPSMGPQQEEQAYQRQQLVNSLRSQYGPNGESSSAGQKMLQNFDRQANVTNSQLQQSQLGTLTNVFGGFNAQRPDLLQTGGNLTNLSSVFQNRMLNSQQATGNAYLNALSGTSGSIIQNAGAQYTGDAIKARGQQQFFNTAVQGGAAFAGGGMPGIGQSLGGLKPPTQAPANG